MRTLAAIVVLGFASLPLVHAGITKVSGGPTNLNGNGDAGGIVSMSADGRYIVFDSASSNLTPGQAGSISNDVFLFDRNQQTIVCLSDAYSGSPLNGDFFSSCPTITPDGRFVCFSSWDSAIVAVDSNPLQDVFVYDRVLGTKELASLTDSEGFANGACSFPTISADGRFVVFQSNANNLAAGPITQNPVVDIYVRDRQLKTTRRVSVGLGGVLANGSSSLPAISGDGRYVAFYSNATNLVANDANGPISDMFRADLTTGAIEIVSVSSAGVAGNAASVSDGVDLISSDGRFVAFSSNATNLVAGDSNAKSDCFLRDMLAQTTVRVSVATDGTESNGDSIRPVVSNDGRYVLFESKGTTLDGTDANGPIQDIYVRDLVLGATKRVSKSNAGVQGNGSSVLAAVSEDGRYFGFFSLANNLVPGDTNLKGDVFLVANRWCTFESGAPGIVGSSGITPLLTGDSGECIDSGYAIQISQGLAAAPAILIVASAELPGILPGFHLDLSQPSFQIPVLLHGSLAIPGSGKATLPGKNLGHLPDLTLHLQVAVLDPSAAHGVALSNELDLVVSSD